MHDAACTRLLVRTYCFVAAASDIIGTVVAIVATLIELVLTAGISKAKQSSAADSKGHRKLLVPCMQKA